MTASINQKCEPSPTIGGANNRPKDIPHNLDITDEGGLILTDETGKNIDT